jgi:hypothetical protein
MAPNPSSAPFTSTYRIQMMKIMKRQEMDMTAPFFNIKRESFKEAWIIIVSCRYSLNVSDT